MGNYKRKYEGYTTDLKKLEKFAEMAIFRTNETGVRYPLEITPLTGIKHEARIKVIGNGWKLSFDLYPPFTKRGRVKITDFNSEDEKATIAFIKKNQKGLIDFWNKVIKSNEELRKIIKKPSKDEK